MTAPISGYSATLPKDVLLDAGVLYAASTPVGASRGGLSFDPQKVIRNIEFDGKRAEILGLDRIIEMKPVISGTMIEFGQADIVFYDTGATSSFANATAVTGVITPKKAGILFATGDYVTNLALVFPRAEQGMGYIRVRFPKAKCNKYRLKGEDKSEGEVEVEFAAVLDMSVSGATKDDAPYVIEGVATP